MKKIKHTMQRQYKYCFLELYEHLKVEDHRVEASDYIS